MPIPLKSNTLNLLILFITQVNKTVRYNYSSEPLTFLYKYTIAKANKTNIPTLNSTLNINPPINISRTIPIAIFALSFILPIVAPALCNY